MHIIPTSCSAASPSPAAAASTARLGQSFTRPGHVARPRRRCPLRARPHPAAASTASLGSPAAAGSGAAHFARAVRRVRRTAGYALPCAGLRAPCSHLPTHLHVQMHVCGICGLAYATEKDVFEHIGGTNGWFAVLWE